MNRKTSGMAVLLENQARQLIDESSHTGTSPILKSGVELLTIG